MEAEQLRDLSKPIDVGVLDTTVAAVYATGSKNDEIIAANLILRDLEAHPHMWLQVPHILQNSNMMSTKFFALQVLESVIKNRRDDLPVEERNELPSYIINVIKQLWNSEAPFGSETVYVNKLYVILVQGPKQMFHSALLRAGPEHEWPVQLTGFNPDLIEVAKERDSIRKEVVAILKLLSEEVVDISRGEMTPQKRTELKLFLDSEYKDIHEFFIGLLSTSQDPDLIPSTLSLYPIETALILNLALFYFSFFKFHIQVLDSEPELLFLGLKYLIGISYVGDIETFKVNDSPHGEEIDLFGEIVGISFSPDTEAWAWLTVCTYDSLLEF